MRISDISDDDLVFLRADGTPSENAIYTQENKDGEIMFFELLGQSKLNGIKLTRRQRALSQATYSSSLSSYQKSTNSQQK